MVMIGYGQNFPDILCAGPLGAAMKAPILMARATSTGPALTFTEPREIQHGIVIGGTGLIPDEAVRTILGLDECIEILAK